MMPSRSCSIFATTCPTTSEQCVLTPSSAGAVSTVQLQSQLAAVRVLSPSEATTIVEAMDANQDGIVSEVAHQTVFV